MFRLVDETALWMRTWIELADEADVIFTATPQGYCAHRLSVRISLKKTKIIDLSADFRLKDVNVYEKWYKISMQDPSYIQEAVYGSV